MISKSDILMILKARKVTWKHAPIENNSDRHFVNGAMAELENIQYIIEQIDEDDNND